MEACLVRENPRASGRKCLAALKAPFHVQGSLPLLQGSENPFEGQLKEEERTDDLCPL